MSLRCNPRGDLPPSSIQPSTYVQRHSSHLNLSHKPASRRLSTLSLSSRPRTKPCHDWMFSSASNVHAALDSSAFKTYIPFDSYVLTISDRRQVYVKGVGTVELKIKRKPDSKESHTILLTDVLHVPSWFCNIFSDIYFDSGRNFEHAWSNSGVQFYMKEKDGMSCWGHTASFCSLDRLVLAKRYKDSRSPMLEDRDREVFSVNLVWPQHQRDRWRQFFSQHQGLLYPRVLKSPSSVSPKSPGNMTSKDTQTTKSGTITRRATLGDINANIVTQVPSKRISSLKATVSGVPLSEGTL